MSEVKYFTKEALIEANRQSIEDGRNATLKPEKLREIPDDQLNPVTMAITHNDQEVRCRIVLDDQGGVGLLDVPFEVYEALPVVEVSE